MLERAWPHIRAALIAVHVLALSAAALPRVGGAALSKSARESPAARAEIEAWTERLASWGLELDAEALEQGTLQALKTWLELRTALNRPFRPYVTNLGLQQPWMLFPGADRYPARMVLELEREGSWQPLQTMYPLTREWRASLLGHTRVRGIVYAATWPVHRPRYHQLGRWFAREAAAEFPDATRLRVSLATTPTRSAEQLRAEGPAEPRVHRAMTFELADYR